MKPTLRSQAQATALLETVDALGHWAQAFIGRTAQASRGGPTVPALVGDGPRLVSPNEAAHLLGVSPKPLSNWRGSGKGPQFVKVGGKVAYPLSLLHLFVEHGQRGEPTRRERAS